MVKAYSAIVVAYMIALIAAWLFLQYFSGANLLLTTFYADVVATIVIFIFSLLSGNSSFYDPYWSVLPFFIALYWNSFSPQKFSTVNNLILAAFLIWGIRLTVNWIRGWKGLRHEDWRYGQLRNQTGAFYPAVNFLGIHFFPTMMVFLGMVPAYCAMIYPATSFNILHVIAFAVYAIAILIESIADDQQRTFKKRRTDESKFIDSGLWKYSRHPNYFGEVLFWWGIYLFVLASNPAYWWTIFGAVAMTMLFLFISIPMMEKHMMEKRPLYAEYQKRVSAFVPWIFK